MTLKPVPACRDPPEVAELDEARSLALSLGQAGAAVAASMGRAKLCGLLIDRREDVTRRPTRDPDAPPKLRLRFGCVRSLLHRMIERPLRTFLRDGTKCSS